MGPSRFGAPGKLAFSFGNPAQDGAAVAEYAFSHGWKTADVVTDKLLVYFQNVCTAFTTRFQQLGGKIVDQESFTQGDKTINNVATRVNGKPASVIAFCTSFAADQPAFVDSLRTLDNKTPIIDGWASDGELLVVEEPEGHQLLLRHLRVGARAGSVRRGPRVRGEDEGHRAAGADRRLHHRRRRDRRDRLRDQEGGRLDERSQARRDPRPT